MRAHLAIVALALSLVACGDPNDRSELFPEANEVFDVTGGFDAIPSSGAHFEGTLTLDQADRSVGTLAGSAALLVTLNNDIFNITDNSIDGANITPDGVVSFSLDGEWTFSGTLKNKAILGGRHTLNTTTDNVSGSWNATNAQASRIEAEQRSTRAPRPISARELAHRLTAIK
jgi:hypothetical protein